jgi:hypothetical protein
MYLRQGASWWTLLAIDLPLFLVATVSVLIFYTVSQAAQGGPLARRLLQLPALMGVGIGLAVNNSRAVVAGFFQDGGVFHRTPKYRLEGSSGGWEGKSYRLRRGLSFYLEAAFAAYFVLCFYLAWRHEMWLSLPFLYLFLQGYVYMTLLGLLPGLGRLRHPG